MDGRRCEKHVDDSGSRRISDDENRSRGLFQLRDPNGMPAQKVFHPGSPVIAVLKADHLWRRTAGTGEVEKIRIGRNYGESVRRCILPNSLVRREPGESRVEDVRRIGKEIRKTADEPGREIRVKQKFQCEARSRPACDA